MALELVYETHAITTDNEAGIATGWLPGELSERGRRNAEDLGRRRRDDGIAAVYVSDLRRALQTAEIAFAGSSVPLIPDSRLRECDYGTLNGTPTAALDRVRTDHIRAPWPGGESYEDVVVRTGELLVDLCARWDCSRVLLIGHSANQSSRPDGTAALQAETSPSRGTSAVEGRGRSARASGASAS